MDESIIGRKNVFIGVYDAKTVRGLEMGLSDHVILLCNVKLVGAWMRRCVEKSKKQKVV